MEFRQSGKGWRGLSTEMEADLAASESVTPSMYFPRPYAGTRD